MDKRFRVVPGLGQGVLDAVAVAELRTAAGAFARRATADNTARSYRAGQEQFVRFCGELGVEVFPGSGEVVALWLAWLARHGYKPATIRARLSGVRRMYALELGERNCTRDRCVLETYEGILRSLDGRQAVAEVVSVKEVCAMAAAWRAKGAAGSAAQRLAGLRNAALLLVGFAGAFRRSELCRIRWEGVQAVRGGVVIDLVHDKSQQRMTGQPVVIHRGRGEGCPVAALEAWGEAVRRGAEVESKEVNHKGHKGHEGEEGRGQENREEKRGAGVDGRMLELHGAVFCGIREVRGAVVFGGGLRGWRVNAIVKEGADLAGVGYRGVSAHSLRAGMITALAMAGVSDRQTMQRSRHRSSAMVGRYVRPLSGMEMDWTAAVGM